MMSALALAVSLSVLTLGQAPIIQPGTKVFLQPMNGFEADLTVPLIGSRVPVVIVKDRKNADLEISGRRTQRRGGSFSADSVEEVTIAITNIQTGVVIDAFTVTGDSVGKVARACAERLQVRMVMPPPPAPIEAPPGPASTSSTLRLLVQGDLNRLTDFTETLRSEMRGGGMTVDIVHRGAEYDYNIIFAQEDATASAIALDRQGVLVASVVDSGFRVKGVTEGAARKRAKRIAVINK